MKNKSRLVVIATLIIGFNLNSNAQVNYGIRAGLNFSAQSERSNLYDGHNYKPGMNLGMGIGYSFNNILSLNAEANYQAKGGKNHNSYENSISDATYHFDYLTVPVLVKAQFSEQLGLPGNWGVFGYAGPYYGWLLNSSADIEDSENFTGSIDDFASETDFGGVFGIGVSHKINSIEVFADLRYEMGMSEIISYDTDLRNKTIAFSIGVNF